MNRIKKLSIITNINIQNIAVSTSIDASFGKKALQVVI